MGKFNFKLGKDALFLSILTLVTVIVWMAMDIYRTLNKTQVPNVLKNHTKPLEPTLPLKTLDNLEDRVIFTEDQLGVLPKPNLTETTIEEEIAEEIAEEEFLITEEETSSGETATESAILE